MNLVKNFNASLRHIPTWPIYIIGAAYAAWLFWLGLNGSLGVDPVKELEHTYGLRGLQLLIAVLCITPLKRFTNINLIKYRRALALVCFGAIVLHLGVWLFLDVQILSQIIEDIIDRPYITIGMAGFVLMIPLAITSNNRSIRKLGIRWRKLHRLTYAIVILGCVHFFMLVKGFQIEPLIYLGIAILLLLLRLPKKSKRKRHK